MNETKSSSGKLGELLQTNKLAIILEIIIVFIPLYLGLLISDNLNSDTISLGGDTVIMGGPLAYLGWILSLALLWIASRIRGAGWNDYGVKQPRNWFVAVLKGLGVALVIFVVVGFVINPILNSIPNLEPRDMSHFSVLKGNLPNLLINLVGMWITAGFFEEFQWRGYLIERLGDLFGPRSIPAWMFVCVISAIIFGLGHAYQGTMGILRTGAIGLVFGLCYLAVERNLWPLVFAHVLIDTLDFIGHYFGG